MEAKLQKIVEGATLDGQNKDKIRVGFYSSVRVPAGWREVEVVAVAERISAKRCKVVAVESLDGHRDGWPSLTGAKRQVFCFDREARNLRGKIKNISSLKILD